MEHPQFETLSWEWPCKSEFKLISMQLFELLQIRLISNIWHRPCGCLGKKSTWPLALPYTPWSSPHLNPKGCHQKWQTSKSKIYPLRWEHRRWTRFQLPTCPSSAVPRHHPGTWDLAARLISCRVSKRASRCPAALRETFRQTCIFNGPQPLWSHRLMDCSPIPEYVKFHKHVIVAICRLNCKCADVIVPN